MEGDKLDDLKAKLHELMVSDLALAQLGNEELTKQVRELQAQISAEEKARKTEP